MKKKNLIKIFKSVELSEDGVTAIWLWTCNHYECMYRTSDHGYSLYWENAVRGANHHIKWHQARRANA